MRPLLHAGGLGVEVDSVGDDDCAGDKLGGKEGKPVHKDAGRAEAAGAPRVQGKEPEGTLLLETVFLH